MRLTMMDWLLAAARWQNIQMPPCLARVSAMTPSTLWVGHGCLQNNGGSARCATYLQGELVMDATVAAPLEWVESVSDLRLPSRANARLQQLMNRNTEGLLTEAERAELETLVELSEQLSLVRATALHLLGRKPT